MVAAGFGVWTGEDGWEEVGEVVDGGAVGEVDYCLLWECCNGEKGGCWCKDTLEVE